ncbi:nickel ABC transporter, nickel/metallophore periplasmic binding protein [Helicobacter sp. MIT 11-5569]|nr:nickel ABC transporter, nickel/metallophore periplasmic binding protein [Helicobacter sp. MIT 11-5569]
MFFPLLSCAQDLVSAWPVNAGPLNPHLYSPNQMYAQVLVYEGLVRYDKDNKIEPAIAESWQISNDGKTYTFTLKEGQLFSDGSTLDAFAVEKNFKAIMLNKMRHSWLGIVNKIESFKALDSTHFELKLNSPYVATLQELSLPRPFRILAPSGFKTDDTSKGIAKPIGSGAWQLAETRLGEYDIFIPNPHFKGQKPAFKRLVVKVLPDPNARVLALQSGAVDILTGKDSLSLENFVRLQKDGRYITEKSDIQGTTMLVINASSERLTKDIAIRKAILHAFNKDNVISGILLNTEQKADNLFSPTLPYADQKLQPYTYNKELAQQFLEDADWKLNGKTRQKESKKLELDLIYIGTNPIQKAIAEALQGDLSKVGITLNLIANEEVSFYQTQKNGKFDLIFNETWGNPYDPHSFLGSMLTSSHADYTAQKDLPNKAEIDKSIQNILDSNAADSEILQKKYHFVLNALNDSAIYLPISYSFIPAVYHKDRIKDFQFGAMQTEFMFHLFTPAKP